MTEANPRRLQDPAEARHAQPGAGPPRGNNLDRVRQHNLSTVLTMVHHSGAMSRSQLARSTGLNRSTISDLVGELVELRLVKEAGPETTNRVGRPSAVVTADENAVAIAVNPEADALTVGLVGLGGYVHDRIRYATDGPMSAEAAVSIAAAIIQGVQSGSTAHRRIVGVGIAVPGLVHGPTGLVRWAPRLQWVDEPISELLAAATGLPVYAGNDASLGAISESFFGAGRGVRHSVYINGGASGIGGGVIVDGRPLQGVDGYAGEFGHTRVGHGRKSDTAGLTGTLEAQVTRAALLRALGLRGADEDELERALLASTAREVARVVHDQLEVLGMALATATSILNPELIILGGFLGSLYAADSAWLEAVVARETLPQLWQDVRITRAALGPNILIVGAAELALAPVLADPANVDYVLAKAQ